MDYNFPVELSEVKTNDLIIPKRKAVIRTDTNQVIGFVSDKYGLVKHLEVMNSFKAVIDKEKYEEKIVMSHNGAKLFAIFSFPDKKIQGAEGDEVIMRAVVINSYNGSNSLQIMLGAFRLVCSNGMILGDTMFDYSAKHFQNGIDTSMIMESFSALNEKFVSSQSIVSKMVKQSVVGDDKLFDKKDKQFYVPKYLLKQAEQKFYNDKEENTVWDYYNSLTSVITHDMKKESIGLQLKLQASAWNRAYELVR